MTELLSRGPRKKALTASELQAEIGRKIRRQRMAFGLRQTDLAHRAELSTQAIQSLEKSGKADFNTVLKVLVALGHGGDVLRMLDNPHYPDIRSQESFIEGPAKTRIRAHVGR